MIGNKFISAIVGILLIGALSLSDNGKILFEIEEWDGKEIERSEELKKQSKAKDWLKLLLGGSFDSDIQRNTYEINYTGQVTDTVSNFTRVSTKQGRPLLFILYCCPKLSHG